MERQKNQINLENKSQNQKKIKSLSNGELVSEVRKKVAIANEAQMQSLINETDGMPKLDALRTTMIDAIKNPEIIPPYELKILFIQMFHLPTDTPEMQQLHENKMSSDNQYVELKRWIRFLQGGLLVLIAGLATGLDAVMIAKWTIEAWKILWGGG